MKLIFISLFINIIILLRYLTEILFNHRIFFGFVSFLNIVNQIVLA
jgi:hypothetical protein